MTRPTDNAAAERAFQLLARSIAIHNHALKQTRLIGNNPGEALARTALFETGCLHLYLFDHEVRRGRLDDGFLMDLWRELATWLMELFPDIIDPNFGPMVAARLARYEDVSTPAEPADVAENASATDYLDEYLTLLARQLVCCIGADGAVSAQSPLFMGVVNEAYLSLNVDAALFDSLIIEVKQTLYEHALPLQQTARLWADGSLFYTKSLEVLDALAERGAAQAAVLWESYQDARGAAANRMGWAVMHDTFAPFRFVTRSGLPLTDAQSAIREVERGNDEMPYLRIELDPSGHPFRQVLLVAHDMGAGLITMAPPSEAGPAPEDLMLSLGGVDGFLRTGNDDRADPDTVPDTSGTDGLQFFAPDTWSISRPARIAIGHTYHAMETVLNRERQALPQQNNGLSGLLQRVKRREAVAEPSREPESLLVRASWVEDATGAGALVIAPVKHSIMTDYLNWVVSPGIILFGEATPALARFSLDDDEDGNRNQTSATFHGPTQQARETIAETSTLFARARETVVGAAGEPYEVIVETSDEVRGRLLIDFALPCYDAGRGLALRAQDGKIVWWCSFGDIVTLLREGDLPARLLDATDSAIVPADPGAVSSAVPPDYFQVPRNVQENIARVLRQIGIPAPRMGVAVTETGESVVFVGPKPSDTNQLGWASRRISWYLPEGKHSFALVDDPNLMPFPIPE